MGIKYFDFDMVVTVAKVYIKLLDTSQTNAYISVKKLDTSLITNTIYDFNRVQQPPVYSVDKQTYHYFFTPRLHPLSMQREK